MKKLIQSLMLAGAMATAGGLAYAQTDGMMGHDGMHHGDPAKMEQMHARHLSELKAKLKITSAQEAAWSTFADSMKPLTGMMAKHPDPSEMDKLTTPERIDKMNALHKEHIAAMEAAMDKRAEATKTFYAALNPDQKKIFDTEFATMGHHAGWAHKMGHSGDKPAQAPKQ